MLKKLQQQLIQSLLLQDTALDFVAENHKISAIKQIEIYRNSMIEGFITALQNVYPVCEKLVGVDFFRAMARHYCKEKKSLSPDLGEFGAFLPEFIRQFKPAESVFYLADVVELEWAYYCVQHGYDEPLLDVNSLQNLSDEQYNSIRFKLISNSRIINSKYPVHRIWEIHQVDEPQDFSVDWNEAATLFVWRQHKTVYITPISSQEYQLLTEINGGKKLADINEELLALVSDLVKRSWINGFDLA